jgi:hypothetical protein
MIETTFATGASTATPTRTALRDALAQAVRGLSRPPTIGFVFASPTVSLDDALAVAHEQHSDVAWLGCSTAGQFTERGLIRSGLVVALIGGDQMDHALRFTSALKSQRDSMGELCGGFRDLARRARERGLPVSTTVTLVDGLGGDGEALVDRLQTEVGGLHEIVGGAAGDDGKFARTVVGAGKRVGSGSAAALHLFTARRWGVGVDHGLKAVTDTMRVTKARANVVYEIDGRPALEVYRDFAKKQGVVLRAENLGPFFINNELGVVLFDTLKKARAPLSAGADGSLTCAAEIPQGAGVCILGGTRSDLLAAADRAAREASERLGGHRAAGILLFDCICRGTILDEDFDREIEAVRGVFPGVPIAGFLTYGEIARYSGRLDGWHNTTAVVAAIPA